MCRVGKPQEWADPMYGGLQLSIKSTPRDDAVHAIQGSWLRDSSLLHGLFTAVSEIRTVGLKTHAT